jgi:glyoxylase-like metal-dependent hydrolase (beta-lactamase superfamily II)
VKLRPHETHQEVGHNNVDERQVNQSMGFWTDAKLLGSPLDVFVTLARKNLLPVRDRIVFIKDGHEFLPGVQAMLTPGHTRGHTGFLLTSGNQSLYLIGDLSHHHVLLLERPRISFAYDLDPTKAADSRVKVLDMLSTDRTAIFGYHFPWPGIGHVARKHGGFRYFPKPTRWITQALASPGRSDEVQVVSGGRLSCRMHR